jgi:hypothetical protein
MKMLTCAQTACAILALASRLVSRTDVAPGYAEDLAGATAFYDAHSGPLLWVTESGISPRGNLVITSCEPCADLEKANASCPMAFFSRKSRARITYLKS